MATPEQMEKKRSRQILEILEAVAVQSKVTNLMVVELVALRDKVTETPDRTGEILATIGNSFGEIRDQQDRILNACAIMATEISELKAEVANAKPAAAVQMPSRKSKK